jgi:hypothetical protein
MSGYPFTTVFGYGPSYRFRTGKGKRKVERDAKRRRELLDKERIRVQRLLESVFLHGNVVKIVEENSDDIPVKTTTIRYRRP